MADPIPGPDSFDISSLPTVSDEAARQVKLASGVSLTALIPAAAAAVAPARATKPGKERWPVKTGTDPDVGEVGKNVVNGNDLGAGIVDTTIEELVRIPRKPEMQPPTASFPAFQEHRSEPVEITIWRLDADIIELKREADGDYHLVLQGESGETMIAEVPTPRPPFVKQSSPWLLAIEAARKEIDDHLIGALPMASFVPVGPMLLPLGAVVQPPSPEAAVELQPLAFEEGAAIAFKTKVRDKRARITGVGFFDRVHGQDGVAQLNGIELHPVLKIEWL